MDGDTIVWDDQQYTIVDLIDDPNDATKIIIDFGTQVSRTNRGIRAWGIFNGSGGSTELNLSEYHKIVQIDSMHGPTHTIHFPSVTAPLTQYQTQTSSNTSKWTSGGYFQTVVTVDGAYK